MYSTTDVPWQIYSNVGSSGWHNVILPGDPTLAGFIGDPAMDVGPIVHYNAE